MQHRCFGETTIVTRRLRFFVYPFLETFPVANQTLVRDVDHSGRLQWHACGWHQEGTSSSTKNVDYGSHFLKTCTGDRAEYVHAGRTPDFAIVGAALGQRLEEFLRDRSTAFIRQFVEGLV